MTEPARTRPGGDRGRTAARRRNRRLLVAAVVFAGLVTVSSFPAGALLSQHRQLATTAGQVQALDRQNAALARQAGHLGDPATVEQLARSDFGFVRPGQQAYDVLPPSGSSSPGAASLSGHVPLDAPPVAPGSSESSNLLGAGNEPTGSSAGSGAARATAPTPGRSHPGFLGRLADTLEFWR